MFHVKQRVMKVYKRNDLTTDRKHYDYIFYYEEMKAEDYKFIIDQTGELKNRRKCGSRTYTTKKGNIKNTPLYTFENFCCGFDIETSTIETVNLVTGKTDYYSAMYVAQFGINNIGVRFRQWDHVREFFIKFPKMFHLAKNEVILTWVHNLDYETSYIKHRFNIDGNTFFGKNRQKPIKFLAEEHIYFHDSYSVSNSSLEMLAKIYNTKHQKTKEDINHNKIRSFLTPIKKKEERYIFNDVFILTDFAKIMFEQYDFTPDTQTQILSRRVNAAALEYGHTLVGEKVWEKWKNECTTDHELLKRLHGYIFGYTYTFNGYEHHVKGIVDPDMFTPFDSLNIPPKPEGIKDGDKIIYDFYQWLIRGGYTKSNARYTSTESYLIYGVQQPVWGFDYISSYPFVATAFNFPVGKFEEYTEDIDKLHLEYDHPDFENWRYIFIIEFENIESIDDFMLESKSKAIVENAIIDNGRVMSADKMRVCLTDCDYALYKKFYKWKDKKVIRSWRAKAGKLPEYLLRPMWDCGEKKQSLKHVKGKEREYMLNKIMFNIFYGLCCKQPVYINYGYTNRITEEGYKTIETNTKSFFGTKENIEHILQGDDEFMIKHKPECCQTTDFNTATINFILSPFWGIWIAAFARFNLLNIINKISQNSEWITNDCLYCDTDSVYFINGEKHLHIINEWNLWVQNRVLKALPPEYHETLGKLGQLDNIAEDETGGYSDKFINFKTLGAKRYIKEYQLPKKKKISVTVAGLPKGVLENFCKRNKKDIYKEFVNLMDFTIESEDLEEQEKVKLGRKYHDELMIFYIGVGEEQTKVVEYSSCVLYPTTFKLKMDKLYLEQINNFRRRVGGGKEWSVYNA